MNTHKLDKVSVLWLMQRFAALGVAETFMCCVAGTYQIEIGLDDGDRSFVVLGTSRVDMIDAMRDLLVKLDGVEATRSVIRTADAADPDGARPISTRSIMEIVADGGDPHAEFLHAEAERETPPPPMRALIPGETHYDKDDGSGEISAAPAFREIPLGVAISKTELELRIDRGDGYGLFGAKLPKPNDDEPPEPERCSLCKEPAHPSETNDRGDHESCADAQRRGDDA